MNNKVCIIHVHLGPLPAYMGYCLAGMGKQSGYQWLLISDHRPEADVSDNVRCVKLSVPQLEKLIHEKLGFSVGLEQTRKLCDLKPAYGKIFEDHLRDFQWWGYCDNDMVFGCFDHFLNPRHFEQYDIISTYPGYMSGPFSLYRNSEKMNRLYSQVPAYKRIFMHPGCMGFDENLEGHPSGRKARDLLLFPFFALDPKNPQNLFRTRFRELRYQYHWAVKRRQALKRFALDMSDLVYRLVSEGKISVYFSDLLLSDTMLARQGCRHWKMNWDRGALKEEVSGREAFAFHFRELKHRDDFVVKDYQPGITKFTLSADGIIY